MLPKATGSWTRAEAAHLMRRAGFGGNPGRIDRLHALGREGAVDHLLDASDPDGAFPAPAWADPAFHRERELAHAGRRRELRDAQRALDPADETAAAEIAAARQAQFREIRRESTRNHAEMQRGWMLRMLATRAPLREKMTLFWHDHFATSLQKVREPYFMFLQNGMFRDHAFGSFHELTRAVVTDPAMMIFLDVQNSRRGRPNENFARELFELFTLGEGNYIEDDVREAARAFTGYRLDRAEARARHLRRQWDDGRKTVFGKTGRFDGPDIVDLVFQRPEPSRLLARKLWEFFACEHPPESAVDAMAEVLRANDHRVGPLLREIFLSREFYKPEVMGNQIKSPVQFIVQLLHELEVDDPPPGFLPAAQQQLGQVLFAPPNVAGWDHGKAWINTHTLLARYNLAGFIATGTEETARSLAAPGVRRAGGMAANPRRSARRWNGPDYRSLVPRDSRGDPQALVDLLMRRFGLERAPARAREAFVEFAEASQGGIPDNEEIGGLCHLMLSTPYYQLC